MHSRVDDEVTMAKSATWPMPGYPVELGEPERVYRHAGSSRTTMILRLLVLLLLTFAIGYVGYRWIVGHSSQLTGFGSSFWLPIVFTIQIAFIICLWVQS